jgi:hypothetical protein
MNPYEPSQLPLPLATSADAVPWSEIFWEWERRRFWYNLILAVIVLLGLTVTGLGRSLAWTMFECVIAGVLANCCYCAGPVVETYLTRFTQKRTRWGLLLFLMGLLFSVIVTLLALEMHSQLFVLERPKVMEALIPIP